MKIKDLIKSIRTSLGDTQEEFAKRIGKKRTDVTKYENGTNIPPGNVLLKIQNLDPKLAKNNGPSRP